MPHIKSSISLSLFGPMINLEFEPSESDKPQRQVYTNPYDPETELFSTVYLVEKLPRGLTAQLFNEAGKAVVRHTIALPRHDDLDKQLQALDIINEQAHAWIEDGKLPEKTIAELLP